MVYVSEDIVGYRPIFLVLPWLVPLFSNLDTVQHAVRTPTLIVSLIHIVNGPVLVGEGILMGRTVPWP